MTENQHILEESVPSTTDSILHGKEGIHSTAVVNSKADIGAHVSIGPYSIIEENVTIGDTTWIGAHAFIGKGTSLGKRCRIFHGAVIGTEPQDLKFLGGNTTVEIGEDTVLREYCTIHRGTEHREKTVVGNRCYLMAYTHVGHDGIIGDNVIMANATNLGGHVVIGDYANIGAMVGLHQFVKVGKHAFIAGGFRLVKDVPPFIMAGGQPMEFSGLNTVGLTRHNFTNEQLKEIKEVYRIIYRSNLNVSQALKKIEGEVQITPQVSEILNFIRESGRGIIPAGRR